MGQAQNEKRKRTQPKHNSHMPSPAADIEMSNRVQSRKMHINLQESRLA